MAATIKRLDNRDSVCVKDEETGDFMKKRRKMSLERKKRRNGFLFTLPWLIGFVFLFSRPLIETIRFSFYEITLGEEIKYVFSGFDYYKRAFVEDANFLPYLSTSLTSILYDVPLIIVFSLTIAYILNKKFFGSNMFKSLFFLPVIIASGVAITIIRGDAYSNIISSAVTTSSLFKSSSMTDILIKANFNPQFISIFDNIINRLFNLTWKSGIQILIFLSAFKSIPESFYEASSIEGATGWESFCKITFPMISPMLLTNIIYTIIDTFTDLSNPVINYVNGLMGNRAGNMDISYSAAISLIYFIAVFAIIIIVYKLTNRYTFYQTE
ncbi:MAG: sugar ABC transporter permease [Eubacteriales bacterium]|nr:sugar ABC transporter permease [Eubacteriales bacterium]